MTQDELRTAIEHTLLDIPFERHDAANAAGRLLPVVWEAFGKMLQAQREADAAEAAAANVPERGGQTRKGMTTTENAGK